MKVSKYLDPDIIKDDSIEGDKKIKNYPPLEKGRGKGSVQQVGCNASGNYSFAGGYHTTASGYCSHAEGGYNTIASGYHSHAEGYGTAASGYHSHSEGGNTIASGDYSHSEGYTTKASNQSEHAEGKYNISIKSKTIHTVGIGTGSSDKKNAHEIHTDGKHYIFGIGGYDGKNSEEKGTKTLQEVVANTVDLDSEQTITALKKFTVAPIMQSGLSMANTRIRNVNTPTNDTDAATKKYVDDLITSLFETVALFEQQNSALESRISELENIISQITIKEG